MATTSMIVTALAGGAPRPPPLCCRWNLHFHRRRKICFYSLSAVFQQLPLSVPPRSTVEKDARGAVQPDFEIYGRPRQRSQNSQHRAGASHFFEKVQ